MATEAYLVEKIQKKVDEKLGVVETNEFVVMADQQKPAKPAKSAAKDDNSSDSKPTSTTETRSAPPASMFSSSAAVTTTPFFHQSTAPASQRLKSKSELQTQLQQLRVKQQQLQHELESGTSFRDVDDVEVEIRLLDQQKAQLKRMIKRL